MWPMIPSLEAIVQACAPAFTLPSFHTHCQLVLGWVMCQGNRIKTASHCSGWG